MGHRSAVNLSHDIAQAKTVMLLQTNAGVLKCDLEGHLANYGWVWFNSQAITNILSLSNIAKKHRVTFNSHGGNIFHVHVKNKPTLKFHLHDNGLYYKIAR